MIQDIRTCWNSIYNMMTRALIFQQTIDCWLYIMAEDDKHFTKLKLGYRQMEKYKIFTYFIETIYGLDLIHYQITNICENIYFSILQLLK
jgi:hypothetical protein